MLEITKLPDTMINVLLYFGTHVVCSLCLSYYVLRKAFFFVGRGYFSDSFCLNHFFFIIVLHKISLGFLVCFFLVLVFFFVFFVLFRSAF